MPEGLGPPPVPTPPCASPSRAPQPPGSVASLEEESFSWASSPLVLGASGGGSWPSSQGSFSMVSYGGNLFQDFLRSQTWKPSSSSWIPGLRIPMATAPPPTQASRWKSLCHTWALSRQPQEEEGAGSLGCPN